MVAPALQIVGRGVGDGDAAVLAACAADGDGQVAFALGDVAGHSDVEQVLPSGQKLLRDVVLDHEIAHERVVARHGAHLRVVEGIRQEAHVDHKIGLHGHAVLEAEREDGDLQELLVGKLRESAAKARAEFFGGQRGGVDDEVGRVAHGAQLAALRPEVAEQTETMEQAMRLLAPRVQPGDMVLLSPACASLDQFKNFEQRGNEFARLAKELG